MSDSLTHLDAFRLKDLERTMSIKSMSKTWPHLERRIRSLLGDKPSGEQLFRLGDQLSDVFRSVPKKEALEASRLATEDSQPAVEDEIAALGNRTQSDVSAGGTVWECLVVWYLNLVCFGTDVLAVRRRNSNTPVVITDAVCVTLHGHSTTTESDVVVYSVSGAHARRESLTVRDLDELIRTDTQKSSVAILQCKTNWNDNAQIPMLWDLIYRSLPYVQSSTVRVGRNGVSPRCFKGESVKYAFVTVPTNTKMEHKGSSVAVNRVLGLSGGNYWGQPTKEGVVAGFSEFLGSNFSEFFAGSIQNHIDRQYAQNPELLERFLSLNFSSIDAVDFTAPQLDIEYEPEPYK